MEVVRGIDDPKPSATITKIIPNKKYKKNVHMKKLIIATVLAAFILQSFNISNTPAHNEVVTKAHSFDKTDYSTVAEKRLASWD